MTIDRILGDYRGFFARQKAALAGLGIRVDGFAVSHFAFRTETRAEYLDLRDRLEPYCRANVENLWNGRAISKLLLKTPLLLDSGAELPLIELIPPVHQDIYRMGLEHVGFVVGEGLEAFAEKYRDKITGRQYQSEICQPFYISFLDHTNVKFYWYSLLEVCIREGQHFDGFHHVWERE